MKKITFLLCVHNHQPVGNFEHVFRKAFTCAYQPFLQCLQRHPRIKATLHFSGSLLEWIAARQPAFLETLKRLARAGQIEMMGGGFYEPIFSILRERDALGQLRLMNDFLAQHFSRMPRGAWIPERVWDPVLPRLLAAAGIEYTLLDSTHFVNAGIPPEEIRGYYATEREGKTVAVFPIDMHLRYSIPFQPPEKTIEYLQFLAADDEHCAITYGDDGEKFGLWPGTFAWVYEQGWLDRFFTLLEENADMICTRTLSEYRAEHPPQGQIYLPTLAYEEMMQWALPADAVVRFETLHEQLASLGLLEKFGAFIRGGYWNNFLAKYPESNQIHKKMLLVSERLEHLEEDPVIAARLPAAQVHRELYRGQCNCPYWHGLFGGVYLNFLRHAVYTHLISAETMMDAAEHGDADWIQYRITDFNKDLSDDILISGRNLNVYCSPKNGGGVFELDYKPCAFNLLNTFTRKREGYHRRLKRGNGAAAYPPAPENAAPTIPAVFRVKEEGLQQYVAYDWYQRQCFLEHILDPATTIESFAQACYTEQGDFITAPFALTHIARDANEPAVTFTLARDGLVAEAYDQKPLRITKTFSIHDGRSEVSVAYTLQPGGTQDFSVWFGVELNLTLLAGNDPLRSVIFPGDPPRAVLMGERAAVQGIAAWDLRDAWNGFGVRFDLDPAADVWMFPIETVSLSDDGLERTYQGTAMLLHWRVALHTEQEVRRAVRMRLYRCAARCEEQPLPHNV